MRLEWRGAWNRQGRLDERLGPAAHIHDLDQQTVRVHERHGLQPVAEPPEAANRRQGGIVADRSRRERGTFVSRIEPGAEEKRPHGDAPVFVGSKSAGPQDLDHIRDPVRSIDRPHTTRRR